jgi:hypothetical protein
VDSWFAVHGWLVPPKITCPGVAYALAAALKISDTVPHHPAELDAAVKCAVDPLIANEFSLRAFSDS